MDYGGELRPSRGEPLERDHRAYEADQWTAARFAVMFLRGVGWQGQRILDLPDDPTAGDHDVRLLEEHLFAVTANQAFLWLDALCRSGGARKKDFRPYLSLKQAITDVRDMREHGQEYLRGGGRHPERFVHEEDGIAVDGSSAVVLNEGYKLGGRLVVEDVMQAAEDALPLVREIEQELRYSGDDEDEDEDE